ncbi:hypothetical protein [Deinococcus sp. QL22]|uniref:hypothetical protein n=1 Tax=Deinococcus sp. QL22 TaxID=2939437 RepID=UPI002016A8C6|nr:hypothetical protein [Deinococcus sp. QL22]UQN10397.1 hypothetical protein M1R55_30045 [Deinococcus sp. QL22]UQN10531.1 hypothetical protein M1R55_29370 [Deinococcus sp. QL22]
MTDLRPQKDGEQVTFTVPQLPDGYNEALGFMPGRYSGVALMRSHWCLVRGTVWYVQGPGGKELHIGDADPKYDLRRVIP